MPATALRSVPLVLLLLATPARAQQAAPSTPAAPASPAEPARPPPASETPAVVAEGNSAQTILGKPVRSAQGEDLGRVVDVIVDRNGTVQAAIIDFGGFLGVGTRKIAVDWHILHFPDSGPLDKLTADLPREQLRKAPVYKEGESIVIMGRATQPKTEQAPDKSEQKPQQKP